MSKKDFSKYVNHSDALLRNINAAKDIVSGYELKNVQHCKELCSLYEGIVKSLHISSKRLHKHRTTVSNGKPGWKEHVEELQAEAWNACKKMAKGVRQKAGPLFENKKCTNASFKYALYIKRSKNTMRSDYRINNVNDF